MITCEFCGTRTHDHEQIKCLSCGANLPVPITMNILDFGPTSDEIYESNRSAKESPITVTTDPAFVWK